MKRLTPLIVSLLIFGVAGTLHAQSGSGVSEPASGTVSADFGLNALSRNSTLPAGALSVRWDLGIVHPTVRVVEDSAALSVAFGILDELEVEATLVPMTLGFFDTEVEYESPTLRARYMMLGGPNELFAELSGSLPVSAHQSTLIQADLMAELLRGNTLFRTGLRTEVTFASEDMPDEDTEVSLSVPSLFYYSVSDTLFVMLGSGFVIQNLRDIETSWALPLSSQVGLSFGEGKPAFDMRVGLTYPQFINSEGSNTDVWSLAISSRAYLWL